MIDLAICHPNKHLSQVVGPFYVNETKMGASGGAGLR